MMRSLVKKTMPLVEAFANSQKYPTRTVESAFAWILIVWSWSVLAHTSMLSDDRIVYGPMLELMPASGWGSVGIIIGLTRIVALSFNGRWRPTPELRLAGAAWGMMFWTMLSWCYYLAIDVGGGPDFPMRRVLFVIIFFEAYSCYRCGQDIGKRQKNEERQKLSSPSMMDAEYG